VTYQSDEVEGERAEEVTDAKDIEQWGGKYVTAEDLEAEGNSEDHAGEQLVTEQKNQVVRGICCQSDCFMSNPFGIGTRDKYGLKVRAYVNLRRSGTPPKASTKPALKFGHIFTTVHNLNSTKLTKLLSKPFATNPRVTWPSTTNGLLKVKKLIVCEIKWLNQVKNSVHNFG
jgi:hypothetical protein